MKSQVNYAPVWEERNLESREIAAEVEEGQLRSVNPRDRTVVGEVELTPPSQVEAILLRAREAQQAWMRRPVKRRVARGKAVVQEVLSWRHDLLDLLEDETGKGGVEARRELWQACEESAVLLEAAQEQLKEEIGATRWGGIRRWSARWQPRGVVLVVASAYEPLASTVVAALSALVAGNAVVVVSDRRAPLVVQSLANIAATAGVADALWQAVAGGARLIDELADRVDGVVSYGDAALTRRIARQQGGRMIPVLGRWDTKDVMIVLNDADIEAAAREAVGGACRGGGRSGRALRRIYVQDTVADDFVDAVVEEVGALRRGQGDDPGPGPLFEAEDLERMERLVEEATAAGARLVSGGRRRPRSRGLYFEPTVLTGVDESMGLWRQDAPGPVVAIARVRAPAEAVTRVRGEEGYGAVSIFTASPGVAADLGARMEAPVVGINEVVDHVPVSSPAVRGSVEGPLDPVGAGRVQALSRRVITVERRRFGMEKLMKVARPLAMEQVLDRAITLGHRQGWVRKTLEAIWPPR